MINDGLSIAQVFENSLDKNLKKSSAKSQNSPEKGVDHAICAALIDCFCNLPPRKEGTKRAAYFSAEFLPGNIATQSLAALGLTQICETKLSEYGFDLTILDTLPDPSLGNGGLGRLAACLLESAAATDLAVDGYGIRYKYGIFKQKIKGYEQTEYPDPWQPYCLFQKEKREESITVCFGDGDVRAVPFDIPIVGRNRVNRLRLWQCEAINPINFAAFFRGDISAAFFEKNKAEAISAFLYPADETIQGKELRLKQQYFFSSASISSILRDFKKTEKPITELPDFIKIQLNDTHPTVAIPELLRLLAEDFALKFDQAFEIAHQIFSYTNHTVMAEALEIWDEKLFCRVLPRVYPYVVMLNNHLQNHIYSAKNKESLLIISKGQIKMANMAVYVCHKVNGVAKIHTDIIKESVFNNWYSLYPERFLNITNGISHRRWLCLANDGLSAFLDEKIGRTWRNDLKLIKNISNYDDTASLDRLCDIKAKNKIALSNYLKDYMNVDLDPQFMYSVQIKRIHEYKRQLLNILAVLGLYIDLKNGKLTDFYPTAFIFSGKAAPGYYNAKQIIKLINSVSALIEKDETARKYFKVLFVPDYNVKNAMKIIPAADLSEQLSAAGTEASGTGNMKLALNGAPTIGTWDGANIEIVEYGGKENNYIFGATKEDIAALTKYDPMDIYYTNDNISRVVDLLKDGPLGDFEVLFKSLLFGNDYNPADKYKVLLDYPSYLAARLKANKDFQNSREYAKKCLKNILAAAQFSSDDTINNYNTNIWQI